jgi:hypothetical protein
MTTIPYDTAYDIVDRMRAMADRNEDSPAAMAEYRAALPESVLSCLSMLYHLGVTTYNSNMSKVGEHESRERKLYSMLGHARLYEVLIELSFEDKFYTQANARRLRRILTLYRPSGVPAELCTALVLMYSASYAEDTIHVVMGLRR